MVMLVGFPSSTVKWVGVLYGRITISGLEPGTVITAKETKTLEGYVLDSTGIGGVNSVARNFPAVQVHVGPVRVGDVELHAGEGLSGYGIHLVDDKSGTNEPMKGVEFLVVDGRGTVVGPNNGYYTTDKDGRITIPNLEPGTVITAKMVWGVGFRT